MTDLLPVPRWPLAPRRRRVWSSPGRAHIEVRLPGESEAMAHAVERALTRIEGVRWAALIPDLARVVVSFEEGEVDLGALIDAIEDLERDHGVSDDPFGDDRPHHPGDTAPFVREAVALAADGAAVGLALAGRLTQMARLPVEVASLIPLVQSQPRVRRLVDAVTGATVADVGLAVANAALQGFAQGPLGLVVDGVVRGSRLAELAAGRDVWGAREPELITPTRIGIRAPRLPPPRPVPLPPGPVEQYSDRAGMASLGAMAVALVTTRDPRRVAAAALAGMPRAAQHGREVFAAHLGRLLARRGVVCLDPTVLRRLDRVDCLAVEGRLLVTGAKSIARVVVLDESEDADEIDRHARRLFDGRSTGRARRRGTWALRRVDRVSRRRLDVRRRMAASGGAEVLGLTHGDALVALVVLDDELRDGAEPLVQAARRAGHMVVVADERSLADRLGADLAVPGGGSLAESVRMLQGDGCSVVLVCGDDPAALRAADCGIGIIVDDAVPWSAHLLADDDLEAARLTVEASAVAYEVSRQSVALALGGSSLGAIMALAMPMPGASARALTAVNVAALAAEANGVRAAVALNRRPTPVHDRQPPWHEMEPDEVLARLESSRAGLDCAIRPGRVRPSAAGRSRALPVAIVQELANPLTPVLAGAAALSATVGSVTDAAMVSSVVALNAFLGGGQRLQVERAVRALEHTSQQVVRVRRDGHIQPMAADFVVRGDVVQLEAGDSIPGDCRILEASGLEVDESSVTGESMPVVKSEAATASRSVADRTSMLWEGTSIAAGSVTAVVVAIGPDTESGRAQAVEDLGGTRAGVEARLQELTRITIPVSLVGGLSLTVAGLLRRIPLRETLHSGVSLAVAAVPEGLPMLATMAQLSAARRLARRGALVRNPRAIEALGRVDLLCADKTGTLTEGHMRLRGVFDGEVELDMEVLTTEARAIVITGLRASPEEQPAEDPLPHLTDRAVVEGAARVGVDTDGGDPPWLRIAELHFEPSRGYHAVLGRNGRGSVLSVKGAPEVVLPRCDLWRRAGTDVEIDEPERRELLSSVERLARRGRRILAVAEREASSRADLDDERVDRLCLLGFLVLSDPVRPTAAHAVSELGRAGVRVVMLTGDHPSTAEGIAADLGLLNGGEVLTGQQLDELDDDALDDALEGVSVFARVTPAHKVRLVQAYQRTGRAVAMTGDGANDAPAIKLAHVGIALGENSTSAARRAADVVVPDGRIETILDAIVEGRAMWSSVREALAILLGGNLGEVGFTVAGAWITGRSPLNARQLLLVNLLTDVLPAMAIAVRPPPQRSVADLVEEGPEASLGRSLDGAILGRAVTTALGAGTAWVIASVPTRTRRSGTVALVALVGTQLGQTLTSGRRDPLVLAAAAGSTAALVAIVQTPGVSQLFGCTPLGPVDWTIAVASAAGATVGSVMLPPLWRRLHQTGSGHGAGVPTARSELADGSHPTRRLHAVHG